MLVALVALVARAAQQAAIDHDAEILRATAGTRTLSSTRGWPVPPRRLQRELMRSICLVAVDGKPRPAPVLTADDKREHARRVTVAPISSTVRGSSTELRVGPVEGVDHESVVKCEHIQTVAAALTVRKIGLLPTSRGGAALRRAVVVAFDLLPLPVA